MVAAIESPQDRARRLLLRPGVWLEAAGAGYLVRPNGHRSRRPLMRLDEAGFRALAADPGLTIIRDGGWTLAAGARTPYAPPASRPGVIEGERVVMERDGRPRLVQVNLGQNPLLWLMTRRDTEGQPWINRRQAAAGERLLIDAEKALRGSSVTMRWDALPRTPRSGSASRPEPSDNALSASERVRRALAACGPERWLVEQVCILGSSQDLEEGRGVSVKAVQSLRAGLDALADHFG